MMATEKTRKLVCSGELAQINMVKWINWLLEPLSKELHSSLYFEEEKTVLVHFVLKSKTRVQGHHGAWRMAVL